MTSGPLKAIIGLFVSAHVPAVRTDATAFRIVSSETAFRIVSSETSPSPGHADLPVR